MNDYANNFRDKMAFYWLNANFAEMGKFSAQVVSAARKQSDEPVEALAHIGMAQHLRATGKYRLALTSVERALTQAEQIGNREIQVDALVERGRILLVGYLDPMSANSDLSEALALALEISYTQGYTYACIVLAQAAVTMGKMRDALRWGDLAAKTAQSHLDHLAVVESGLLLGQILSYSMRTKEADSILDDTLSLCKRMDYRYYRPLVAMEILLNRPVYTAEHVRILQAYAEGNEWAEHTLVQVTALEGLVRLHRHDEMPSYDMNQAFRVADKLRALAVDIQHPPFMFRYLNLMGDMHLQEGNYDEADVDLRDTVMLAREFHNPYQEMRAQRRLGEVYSNKRDYEAAFAAYEQARDIAASLKDDQTLRGLWLAWVITGALRQLTRLVRWFTG
jgi:tetratricopeptide (TPR) repeat protein